MIKICLQCEEVIDYNIKRGGSKFCSEKCGNKFRNNRASARRAANLAEQKKDKKCENCQVDISLLYKSAKYCSQKCSNVINYAKIAHEKTCVNCQKEFLAKTPDATVCSAGCSNTFYKKNADVELICKECGSKFTVEFHFRYRQFCTQSCVTIYGNRNRDNEAVNKKISKTKILYYETNPHPWQGKHHSEETKKLISDNLIGKMSGEANPMFGKNHTQESREQMSKTRAEHIVNGNYAGWFDKGQLFSTKAGKEVSFRSSWEKKIIEYIETCDDVVKLEVEPLIIQYYRNEGQRNHLRNYIPDFLITYNDGRRLLVEIKPTIFVTYEVNVAKFAAARTYCENNNMKFEIWDQVKFKELGVNI